MFFWLTIIPAIFQIHINIFIIKLIDEVCVFVLITFSFIQKRNDTTEIILLKIQGIYRWRVNG